MSVRDDMMTAIVQSLAQALAMTVEIYKDNFLSRPASAFPVAVLRDTGAERPVVKDSTHTRYRIDLAIEIYVRTDTAQDALNELASAVAGVKSYIHSAPVIDDVLGMAYIESDAFTLDPTTNLARSMITIGVVYVCENGVF